MKNIFVVVPEQERWIVEQFGSYSETWKPGLKVLVPVLMKIRAKVDVRERPIPLFVKPIKIDFPDGSATPQGAQVFVKILNPDTPYDTGDGNEEDGVYRSIYRIKDFEVAIRDLIENALRSYLNSMTLDAALVEGKTGYNLVNYTPNVGLPNEELERIKKSLREWGFELCKITIQDFDLNEKMIEARDSVQIGEKRAKSAEFEAIQRATKTVGTIIQMMAKSSGDPPEEIQESIKKDPEWLKKFFTLAKEMTIRQQAIDGRSFLDIRTPDAKGNVLGELIALICAGKLSGSSDGERREDEETGGGTERKKRTKSRRESFQESFERIKELKL